jgi:hypothetical protein
MAEARAAYRSLFRSLSKHVSPDAGSKWHTFARKEFNRLAKVGDPVAMQQALQTAKDYADLVSSIQSHKVRHMTSEITRYCSRETCFALFFLESKPGGHNVPPTVAVFHCRWDALYF